jgi:hypothetical protein
MRPFSSVAVAVAEKLLDRPIFAVLVPAGEPWRH